MDALIDGIVHPAITQITNHHRHRDAESREPPLKVEQMVALKTSTKERTHQRLRISDMLTNSGIEDELRPDIEQSPLSLQLFGKPQHRHILDTVDIGIVEEVVKALAVERRHLAGEAVDVIREPSS